MSLPQVSTVCVRALPGRRDRPSYSMLVLSHIQLHLDSFRLKGPTFVLPVATFGRTGFRVTLSVGEGRPDYHKKDFGNSMIKRSGAFREARNVDKIAVRQGSRG